MKQASQVCHGIECDLELNVATTGQKQESSGPRS
jgi:hypothetical protein